MTSGYEEQSLFTPRWLKSTGEIYGRCPGINSMPDTKMLQEMMKETLISAQLNNRPPVIVSEEQMFEPLATVPGGVLYARRGQEPKPYNPGSKPQIAFDIIEDVRARIQKSFYIDRTMLAQGTQATATEILKIVEEKLRSMGPILGRMQSEILGPMITRAFNLLMRRGKIDNPPELNLDSEEEYYDLDISVEYVSPLAMAQRQQVAENITRALVNSEGFFGLDANSAQNIDADKGVRDVWEMFGVANILRSKSDVVEMREKDELARSEEMQKQEAMEGLSMANAAKEVANVTA